MSFVEPDDSSCFALLLDRTSNDSYFSHYTNHSLIEQDQPITTSTTTTSTIEDQTNAILNDDEFRLLLNPNLDHTEIFTSSANTYPQPTEMPSPKSSYHIRKISHNDSSLREEQDEVNSQFTLEDDADEDRTARDQKQFLSSGSPSKNMPPFTGEHTEYSSVGSHRSPATTANIESIFHDIPSSASRSTKPSPFIRRQVDRKYNKDKCSASLPVLPTAPTQSFESKTEDESSIASFSKNLPLINVDDASLTENDVLCGRGGGTNSYIGNRHYRALVQSFQPTYLKARRKDKPLMARDAVKVIRKRGGRFLKRDSKTRKWNDIGDEKAEAKTGQALREGLDVRATNTAAANLLSRSKKTKVSPTQTYSATPERRTIMISGLPDAHFSPLSFSPKVGPALPRFKRTRFEVDDVFPRERVVKIEHTDDITSSSFQPPRPRLKKVKYAYDHIVTKPSPPILRGIEDDDEADDDTNRQSQDIFRSKSEDTSLTPGQFEYWVPSRSWSRESKASSADNTQTKKGWAV